MVEDVLVKSVCDWLKAFGMGKSACHRSQKQKLESWRVVGGYTLQECEGTEMFGVFLFVCFDLCFRVVVFCFEGEVNVE